MEGVSRDENNKKLKILCMHGIGTNKEFMMMQTTILRKDLQEIAELIYVDAPFQFPLDMMRDPKVLKNLTGKAYSWFNLSNSHKTRPLEQLIAEHKAIRKVIQAGSSYYDGALCFSQGSFYFQFLLWQHAKGKVSWPIIQNMKFFINFNAHTYKISRKGMEYKRLEIPSMHFLSEQDFMFNRCLMSPTLYVNPEIIYHSFGHRFPVLGTRQKQQLRSFLMRHGWGQKSKENDIKTSRL